MLRILRFIAEFIAAFVGVIIVLSVLLVWRLSEKPVSSDFMTPYIESGIESIIPGSHIKTADTLLMWDNVDHSILLHMDNIKVTDAHDKEIADIPTLRARINVVGLLFGQFMPREMIIDHPQIELERNKSGAYVFAGMVMTTGTEDKSPDEKPIREVLQNAFDELTHASLIHRLAITQAVFNVHDEAAQTDWSVGVPEISIKRNGLREVSDKLQYGALEGRMTVEVTQKDGPASLDITYAYDPEKHQHSLSTAFDSLTPAYLAGGHPETLGLAVASIINLPLTGKVNLFFDGTMALEKVDAQIHGDAGHLVYTAFWDKPFAIKSFDVNAAFDRAEHKLEITDTHIDLGDATLDVIAKGTPPSREGQDLNLAVTVTADNLPMNRYDEVCPKPVLPNPRYWLVANLRDGMFNHAEGHVNGSLNWNDPTNITVIDAGGKVTASGARVTYLEGMPAAEGVSAEASFDMNKMTALVTGGGLDNIRMQPFTIEINGLSDVDQDIHIPLQVSGPVPEMLRLLDHQPLGYAKKLGVSPDDIQGNAQGLVDFKFPLLRTLLMKDVNIYANATATNVASAKIIPGVAIDQGNLALMLDMSGFGLKGQTNLNKLPFQVAWQEYFDTKPGQAPRKINVSGIIRDNQWNNFGITTFDGSKGPMAVNLELKRPDKKKLLFTGSVDMKDSALQVNILGWKKPANTSAFLTFTATAPDGENVKVTNFDLRGDHVHVTGDASFSPDMSKLLSVNAPNFILGRTDATVHFTQGTADDSAVAIEASGNAVDISGIRGQEDSDKATPHPQKYDVSVGKLYTSSTGEIDNAQGFASRDVEGWSEINLHGLANGDKPLSIELTPQADGHRTLSILCDDFGEAMQGLGFTDTIKGGKLKIMGQSTIDNPRVINGTAKISDFSVEKLPALAILLNATSPFGFADILTDRASFSRFEGDFVWQGDTLNLTKAHAAGSAIGINVDGKVNISNGDANLQGTLVPFTTVNKILSYIPLIGDLLTGGDDQGVLAVSYQIKGSLSDPKVSVNPVSLLAPGFIRNLFFRDDTSDDN